MITGRPPPVALSGRVGSGPSHLLHSEVLRPQFELEVRSLLSRYVAIEKVLVLEYLRMGLLTPAQAVNVGRLLDTAGPAALAADPATNMSDLAFALEQHVEFGLVEPIANWHVDRSRNDLQACAQLMFGRDQVLDLAQHLLVMGASAHRLAAQYRATPMPGHTHFQAAQIITPGFYLAALSGQVLHTLRRLLATFDGIDACPLGSGAMAGQHLQWDRDRMARLLGFAAADPHALTGVASRNWAAEITAELSLFGVAASRFATDLITWGDGEHRFLDLPDELCGISSAMPQKKNFPILERIRGKTAHLSSCHVDVVLGQRNTPYTNLVEVSKEAGVQLYTAFDTARSTLLLFTAVLDNLSFRADRMRAACEDEYLGGFTLANLLTLRQALPWRRAQVLAGRYIVAAMESGRPPADTDPALLAKLAAELGFPLTEPGGLLAEAFDVERSLLAKQTAGSVHPDSVAELLSAQAGEYARLQAEWTSRRVRVTGALAEIDRTLDIG